MDVRNYFKTASANMRNAFNLTAEAHHNKGKGDNREEIISESLKQVLPNRYNLAHGEVVTSQNEHSHEMDVAIIDSSHCPALLLEHGHSLIPIETVYGGIEVKSTLTSDELKDAYEKIKHLKAIAPPASFTLKVGSSGWSTQVPAPLPVGVVVAFKAGRSLEAIADQARKLDAELPGIKYRPDLIVILDEGIIGPRSRLRSEANILTFPEMTELTTIQRSKHHTWLNFCLRLIDELNSITLRPLEFYRYLRVPERIDGHLVSGHDRFVRPDNFGKLTGTVRKIAAPGIQKILDHCKMLPIMVYGEVLRHQFGEQMNPPPNEMSAEQLAQPMKEYNPRHLPPMDITKIVWKDDRPIYDAVPYFSPSFVRIDGETYAVDVGALSDGDFVERTDLDLDEMLVEDNLVATLRNASEHTFFGLKH
jgi:hypothetical protein